MMERGRLWGGGCEVPVHLPLYGTATEHMGTTTPPQLHPLSSPPPEVQTYMYMYVYSASQILLVSTCRLIVYIHIHFYTFFYIFIVRI